MKYLTLASCIRLTQLPFLFLKWWGNFFDEIFFFEEFFDKIIDPRTMRRYSCNLNTKIYLLTLKSASSKFTGEMRDCWSTKTWILDLTLRTKDQGNALKSSKDITFKKKKSMHSRTTKNDIRIKKISFFYFFAWQQIQSNQKQPFSRISQLWCKLIEC